MTKICLALCLFLFIIGCDKSETAVAQKPSDDTPQEAPLYAKDVRGQQSPELHVEEWLTEKPATEGKVVLIDFWATWCGPCVKSIPKLNEWQKKYKDQLVIIGVSDESADKVKEFMKTTTVDYSMAVDTQARVKKELDIKAIPNVFVIDRKGIVRWQGIPGNRVSPLTSEVLAEIIAKK